MLLAIPMMLSEYHAFKVLKGLRDQLYRGLVEGGF